MTSFAIEQALLTASFALPAFVFLFRRRLPMRPVVLFLACCAFVYLALLARVEVVQHRIESHLASFDLNRDGAFSEAEATPQQVQALAAWSNDTARGMAPITGLVVSPLVVLLAYSCVALVVWLRARTARLFGRRG